jgi:hypothetical protein
MRQALFLGWLRAGCDCLGNEAGIFNVGATKNGIQMSGVRTTDTDLAC